MGMPNMPQFEVWVRNVGEDEIGLPEIQKPDGTPYPLAVDEELNMMADHGEYGRYNDPAAVRRALLELSGTELYQQREAGNLQYQMVLEGGSPQEDKWLPEQE